MKKKIISVLLASMMVIGLVGCGGSKETADGAKSDSGDGLIKVGIINNDPNESGYRTANDKDLKATFTKENGYDASFAYSLKNDEQITSAQKFIQDGVDYLLLSAADTAGWDSVLKDAQDAGTQVILFDRTIDADESLYAASIVSDMEKEGETAANWLKDQKLPEYNIIHIQGVMGSAAQKGRSGALADTAKSEGWNIVTEQTAEWNAEKAQQLFAAASTGTDEPAGMMFYNDQPADMIMYQGLALKEMGEPVAANSRFYKLISYGEAHIYDEVKMDYFAVSYPDLLIFDENFTRKNKAHCCYLMGLGNLGLGNLEKAKEHFEETLQLDPHHLLARLYLRGIEGDSK